MLTRQEILKVPRALLVLLREKKRRSPCRERPDFRGEDRFFSIFVLPQQVERERLAPELKTEQIRNTS